MGENQIEALLAESMNVALKLGAAKPSDFTKVIVDTTVAEKNITFPPPLGHVNMPCRAAYKRVGKYALIMYGRYAHAKQYKRARRQLKRLKTFLGRIIRDIGRQIKGDAVLEDIFREKLWKAERVRTQKPRDDIPKKIYSLHAPEVECIHCPLSDMKYR